MSTSDVQLISQGRPTGDCLQQFELFKIVLDTKLTVTHLKHVLKLKFNV